VTSYPFPSPRSGPEDYCGHTHSRASEAMDGDILFVSHISVCEQVVKHRVGTGQRPERAVKGCV
jgi:hypothetical protein